MDISSILLVVVFFVIVACTYNAGLWSNAITLFNVMTAALLASVYADPVTHWLVLKAPSYVLVWDFISYWGVFCVSLIVFRSLTDILSKSKVRFKKPVDTAGGIFISCWTAWVVVCFTAMTMHLAPLDRKFMGDSFNPKPEDRMFWGMGPDHQWLGFIHSQSLGGLSRSGKTAKAHEFDPNGEFIFMYGQRRQVSQDLMQVRVP